MKASRIYKYKINKNSCFVSQSPKGGTMFWPSKDKGTYRRGVTPKPKWFKNPFDRQRV